MIFTKHTFLFAGLFAHREAQWKQEFANTVSKSKELEETKGLSENAKPTIMWEGAQIKDKIKHQNYMTIQHKVSFLCIRNLDY